MFVYFSSEGLLSANVQLSRGTNQNNADTPTDTAPDPVLNIVGGTDVPYGKYPFVCK